MSASMRTLRRRVARWGRYYARYERAGIRCEIQRGAQVMSTQMAVDYVPPSASLSPAVSAVAPYWQNEPGARERLAYAAEHPYG